MTDYPMIQLCRALLQQEAARVEAERSSFEEMRKRSPLFLRVERNIFRGEELVFHVTITPRYFYMTGSGIVSEREIVGRVMAKMHPLVQEAVTKEIRGF